MKRKMCKKLMAVLCAGVMAVTGFVGTVFAEDVSALSPDEIANGTDASGTNLTVIDSVDWTEDTKLTFTNGTDTYVICMVEDKLSICNLTEDGAINKSVELEDSDCEEVETLIMDIFMFLVEELKWTHSL